MHAIVATLEADGFDLDAAVALREARALEQYWQTSEEPEWMLRVAGIVGLDPRWSVRMTCQYVERALHDLDLRDEAFWRAISVVRSWLQHSGKAQTMESLLREVEALAQQNAEARRGAGTDTAVRRTLRAVAYASQSVASLVKGALAAAIVTEIEYDADYTFDDAWAGASRTCAYECADAMRAVVEVSVSVLAARVSTETGSDVAGKAAAHDSRIETRRKYADDLRAMVPLAALLESRSRQPR